MEIFKSRPPPMVGPYEWCLYTELVLNFSCKSYVLLLDKLKMNDHGALE